MADPLLPIRTNKNIQSSYIRLSNSDVFFNSFDTSSQKIIDNIVCSGTKGINDHNIVSSPNDSLCAMTASYNGSNSGYWYVTRKLMLDRGGDSSLTATDGTDQQLGIITLRKKMYDVSIVEGSFTATVTGVNYQAIDISGDYYDDGEGNLIRASDSSIVGNCYLDEGMFVVTSSTLREVATSITSVTYKTQVNHNNLSVYCKCPPDQFNFTLNHTSAATADLNEVGIEQSYDNIYTKSSLTSSTNNFVYWPDLVLSGYAFSPIITHVGLYNDNNDLLAVAKLANAIKKPNDLPITIKVSIDL